MTKNKNKWVGWHFLKEDKRLRWGTKEVVKKGRVYCVEGELKLCEFGLHASKKPLDALKYAPGPIVCLVELRGEILEGEDKACATKRKVLKMADATKVLHEFACWCAGKVKRAWLKGKATNEELGTARDTAWDAAWDAARDVARDAAWDATRGTARDTAWDATWDATWTAAWAAARAEQNDKLNKMLTELIETTTI